MYDIDMGPYQTSQRQTKLSSDRSVLGDVTEQNETVEKAKAFDDLLNRKKAEKRSELMYNRGAEDSRNFTLNELAPHIDRIQEELKFKDMKEQLLLDTIAEEKYQKLLDQGKISRFTKRNT
jgi:hypothetical protein